MIMRKEGVIACKWRRVRLIRWLCTQSGRYGAAQDADDDGAQVVPSWRGQRCQRRWRRHCRCSSPGARACACQSANRWHTRAESWSWVGAQGCHCRGCHACAVGTGAACKVCKHAASAAARGAKGARRSGACRAARSKCAGAGRQGCKRRSHKRGQAKAQRVCFSGQSCQGVCAQAESGGCCKRQ